MRCVLRWLGFLLVLGALGCASQPGASVCMAGAVLDAGGQCVAQRAPVHFIPFRAGFKTQVSQGFHGPESHHHNDSYSVDFECEEGDPIVASRSGRVWATREDSNHGCADPACVGDSNYVILDHGDGTFSEYHHLRYLGAMVDPGDRVCAGQVIAVCGSTGYSTGPHLHYAVTDSRRTIPVRFVEGYHQRGSGVPVPKTRYVSENQLRATCSDRGWSELGRGAFLHHGIELDSPMPQVIDRTNRQVIVRGQYFGEQPRVAIHRRSRRGGTWITECVDRDQKGRFEFRLDWPERRFPAGSYLMMMTGSDAQCMEVGWAWSYGVQVMPR